jgi:hypothetical protein
LLLWGCKDGGDLWSRRVVHPGPILGHYFAQLKSVVPFNRVTVACPRTRTQLASLNGITEQKARVTVGVLNVTVPPEVACAVAIMDMKLIVWLDLLTLM